MKHLPFTRTRFSKSCPPVPATWPSRAIRRAVVFGRALPQAWATFFLLNPELKTFIRSNRMVSA